MPKQTPNETEGHWIEYVFIDNELIGGMWQEELAATQAAWEAIAVEAMRRDHVDHVEYCTIKYDDNNLVKYAHFYITPLSDLEYQEKTTRIRGNPRQEANVYVGVIHRQA